MQQLRNCIGKRLHSVFGRQIRCSQKEIAFVDLNLVASFKGGGNIGFRARRVYGEGGNLLYDFTITNEVFDCELYSEYVVESAVIVQVDVYGRTPLAESSGNSRDMFVFHTNNGEDFLIVLHPDHPSVSLFFGSNSVDRFLAAHAGKYTLTQSLT